MHIDIQRTLRAPHHSATRVTFTAFGKTLNIEVNDIVPEKYLQEHVKHNISGLIWDEIFEKEVSGASMIVASEILQARKDVNDDT